MSPVTHMGSHKIENMKRKLRKEESREKEEKIIFLANTYHTQTDLTLSQTSSKKEIYSNVNLVSY